MALTASPGPPQVWSQHDNAAFRILNEALAAHGSPEAKLPGIEGDEAPRPFRHSKPAQTLTPTRALALTLALALALTLTPAPTPTLALTWPRPRPGPRLRPRPRPQSRPRTYP